MVWDLFSLSRKGLFSLTAMTRLREDFQVDFSCVFGEGEAFPEDSGFRTHFPFLLTA